MNNFEPLQIPGTVEIMGRIDITWLGVFLPALILIIINTRCLGSL